MMNEIDKEIADTEKQLADAYEQLSEFLIFKNLSKEDMAKQQLHDLVILQRYGDALTHMRQNNLTLKDAKTFRPKEASWDLTVYAAHYAKYKEDFSMYRFLRCNGYTYDELTDRDYSFEVTPFDYTTTKGLEVAEAAIAGTQGVKSLTWTTAKSLNKQQVRALEGTSIHQTADVARKIRKSQRGT